MTSVAIALPPLGEISLITIWIGTVLYGVNCMLYGLCMYLLVSKKRHNSRWVLMLTSTVLFILCTVYVAASLQQLLVAFIYVPAGLQDYPVLYFSDYTLPIRTLKDVLYITLTFVQDIVLIWRLYVVFGRDWRIPAFFLLIDLAYIGVGYVDIVLLSMPSTDVNTLISLTIAGWILDLILNIFVTLTIAARIWWIGKPGASFRATHSSGNPYSNSMYVIIESGAIFSIAIIVMMALYGHDNGSPFPYTLPSLDVGAQLAVLTPLLIVVRVELHQNNIAVSETSGTEQSPPNTGNGLRTKLDLGSKLDLDDRAFV